MPTGKERTVLSVNIARSEREWLNALAEHYGISISAVVKMLLHSEAERRGLKKRQLPPEPEDNEAVRQTNET